MQAVVVPQAEAVCRLRDIHLAGQKLPARAMQVAITVAVATHLAVVAVLLSLVTRTVTAETGNNPPLPELRPTTREAAQELVPVLLAVRVVEDREVPGQPTREEVVLDFPAVQVVQA